MLWNCRHQTSSLVISLRRLGTTLSGIPDNKPAIHIQRQKAFFLLLMILDKKYTLIQKLPGFSNCRRCEQYIFISLAWNVIIVFYVTGLLAAFAYGMTFFNWQLKVIITIDRIVWLLRFQHDLFCQLFFMIYYHPLPWKLNLGDFSGVVF